VKKIFKGVEPDYARTKAASLKGQKAGSLSGLMQTSSLAKVVMN